MFRLIIAFLVLFGWVDPSVANIGGFNYGSVAVGDFRPMGTNQVEIKSEKLKISLFRGYASVEVQYVLRNTGDAVEVEVGFPSMLNSERNIDWGWGQKEKGDYKEITEYSIKADGMALPFRESKPEWAPWFSSSRGSYVDYVDEKGEPLEFTESDGGDRRPAQVSWFVSKIPFEPGKERKVSISYLSRYVQEGSGGERSYIYDPQIFTYLFSTGGVWKGPIKTGEVEIRAVSVDVGKIAIKPKGRFVRSGKSFKWKFKDLEPKASDDLEVCLNDGFSVLIPSFPPPKSALWYSLDGKDGESFRFFSDCAVYSSSNRSAVYQASNLLDRTSAKVWAAGGKSGGIGESVTFVFDEPSEITDIGISSGMAKTYGLYKANNRPRLIELSVDGEAPIRAVLEDEHVECCDNDDRGYHWISLVPDGKTVRKVVLRILDVYKGDKYDDTCNSDVMCRTSRTEKRDGAESLAP